MSYSTTIKRINKVLKDCELHYVSKEKFTFGSAVLMLAAPELAKKMLYKTAIMREIEEAFISENVFTAQQMEYLFHDCLEDAFHGGAYRIYMLLYEFADDLESLKEVVARYDEGKPNCGPFSYSVNKLALKILSTVDDKEQTIVDYCSGNGILLSQAYLMQIAKKLCGEESNRFCVDVIMALKLKALGCTDAELYVGDVLREPRFIGRYNRVFANYPLGLLLRRNTEFVSDNYTGLAKLAQAKELGGIFPDWYFMNILLNSLAEQGKAVTITSANRLFAPKDAPIREQLIKDGKVEAVILFGNGIFPKSNVAAAMVVLSNNNKAPRLIDARNFGMGKSRGQDLSEADIAEIFNLYIAGQASDAGIVIPTAEQLAAQDYSLSLGSYSNPLKGLALETTAVLGDVVTVQRGLVGVGKANEEVKTNNCYLVKIANIEGGAVEHPAKIALDSLDKLYNKQLQKGDVLLAAKGTQTKAAIIEQNYDMPIFADQNILVLRPKQNSLNSYYLTALLNSDLGEKILKAAQTGDQIVSISPNRARSIVIPIVAIDKQAAMAAQYTAKRAEIAELQLALQQKKEDQYNLINELLEISCE